ncbi:hypothetical protein V5799_023374 [Amblyomma americanum]|uniref:Uncharacterized protein n=1 Tax=Amblyomma americanum TaxID=6943 RepID=A0AAQ4FJB7_AMBAM
MLKAGKSLESVGRLLQGDASLTKEEQEEVLQVLSALTSGEAALSGEDAEYSWSNIIKGVIEGAGIVGIVELIKKLG